MTGGQDAVGALPVPALTRKLEAEGVRKTVVLTDDLEKYTAEVPLASNADVRDRDELPEVLRELEQIPGVTVIILRSAVRGREAPPALARKAGRAHAAGSHQRSSLRGLRRLRTPIELHEPSPGADRVRPEDAHPSILVQQGLFLRAGRLPVVRHREDEGGYRTPQEEALPAIAARAKCPSRADRVSAGDGYAILAPGIGGTGVVTINALLATAAWLESLSVITLDQTGSGAKRWRRSFEHYFERASD